MTHSHNHQIIRPLTYLSKDLTTEARAVVRYAAGQEASVRRAFMEFIDNVQSEDMVASVRVLLERGDIQGALDSIQPYVQRFGSDLTDVFMDTAYDEGSRLRNLLGGGFAAAGFDPTYPRAAQLMRDTRLDLITNFTAQQELVTRRALVAAINSGDGPLEAARVFRDTMGLTPAQQDMIDSFQNALEVGNSSTLDRVLRDRRYDTQIEASLGEDGEPLTADQIETMVGRYTDRMLSMRADTIARTETQRILNLARDESTRQVVAQAGFSPGQVVRTWTAVQDARTRDSHAMLDGQERGLNEPFETEDGVELMFPGDPDAPPEETINCRCVLQIDFSDDVKSDDAGDDEE